MNRYLTFLLAILVITFLGLATPALAGEADDQSAPQPNTTAYPQKEGELPRKLTGNNPSYFVYTQDNDNAFDHIEFYLSVKYPMLENTIHNLFGPKADLHFNYNGKYDFYLVDRYSSPVISRLQNPGIMFSYPLDHSLYGLATIKTGYFHESNGQTIDTAAEYASTENSADFVSRGWDYIPLELEFDFILPQPLTAFTLFFKGRYFMDKQLFKDDKEDSIFWETNNDARIEDYDGLSLELRSQTVFDSEHIQGLKLAATFRSGYKDFNLSHRYKATFRALGLPLYIFYFKGYGTEIATYHKRGYTLGLGVEFW